MREIHFESPSVQSYLGILQGIINRMAANSSGCKTWCVAIVSAILGIVADKAKPEYLSFISLPQKCNRCIRSYLPRFQSELPSNIPISLSLSMNPPLFP